MSGADAAAADTRRLGHTIEELSRYRTDADVVLGTLRTLQEWTDSEAGTVTMLSHKPLGCVADACCEHEGNAAIAEALSSLCSSLARRSHGRVALLVEPCALTTCSACCEHAGASKSLAATATSALSTLLCDPLTSLPADVQKVIAETLIRALKAQPEDVSVVKPCLDGLAACWRPDRRQLAQAVSETDFKTAVWEIHPSVLASPEVALSVCALLNDLAKHDDTRGLVLSPHLLLTVRHIITAHERSVAVCIAVLELLRRVATSAEGRGIFLQPGGDQVVCGAAGILQRWMNDTRTLPRALAWFELLAADPACRALLADSSPHLAVEGTVIMALHSSLMAHAHWTGLPGHCARVLALLALDSGGLRTIVACGAAEALAASRTSRFGRTPGPDYSELLRKQASSEAWRRRRHIACVVGNRKAPWTV